MIKFDKKSEFFHNHTVAITLTYMFETSELVTDKLPKSCDCCPVGYRFNNDNNDKEHVDCGWEPMDDFNRRPSGCKLKTIEQWLIEKADEESKNRGKLAQLGSGIESVSNILDLVNNE